MLWVLKSSAIFLRYISQNIEKEFLKKMPQNKKNLFISCNSNPSNKFPVYCKYQANSYPQPAFIFLDLRDSARKVNCYAGYMMSSDRIPYQQRDQLILRFRINSDSTIKSIESIFEAYKNDFQFILNGSTVKYHDNSKDLKGELTPEASKVFDRLYRNNSGFCSEQNGGMVNRLGDVLGEDIYPSGEGETLDSFARDIYRLDGRSDFWFGESLNSVGKIRLSLLDLWCEKVKNNIQIPKVASIALVDAGICLDAVFSNGVDVYAKL